MEKVRQWCGQPSDRGRLRNRTDDGIGVHLDEISFRTRSNGAVHTCAKECLTSVAIRIRICDPDRYRIVTKF